MDISNWSWSQILQLPDHLFGRRFVVSNQIRRSAVCNYWGITKAALPEKCVLWEFTVAIWGVGTNVDRLRIHLGDFLPTTTAEMDLLDRMITDYYLDVFAQWDFSFQSPGILNLSRIKLPIDAKGRRVILEVVVDEIADSSVQSLYVISSVPKEIPDWYLTHQG